MKEGFAERERGEVYQNDGILFFFFIFLLGGFGFSDRSLPESVPAQPSCLPVLPPLWLRKKKKKRSTAPFNSNLQNG